ncbi:MAG: hypothetical protein LBN12_05695, partial [Clostridiales Family XIII bacterium]|nr:hypothetical protein [Clostridiales Family XIII bacterium]
MAVRKIRFRIIVLFIVGAIIIVGVGLLAGLITTQNKVEATMDRDLDVIANMADRLISSEMDLLREKDITLAHSIAYTYDTDLMAQVIEEQLGKLEYKDFIGITIFNQTGAIASIGRFPISTELLDDEYIQRAFEGEAVYSTVRQSPGSDKLVIHICVPVRKNVVLVATVDGLFFHNFLKDFKIWDTGHVFLMDGEGYMISNPREEWIHDRINPIVLAETDHSYDGVASTMKRMIQGESGVSRYTIDGVERICVYRPVSSSLVGWSLGAVAPLPESPMNDIQIGFLIVLIICLILCALTAFIIS